MAANPPIKKLKIPDLFNDNKLKFRFIYTIKSDPTKIFSSKFYKTIENEKIEEYSITLAIIYDLKKSYSVTIGNNTQLQGKIGWIISDDDLVKFRTDYNKLANSAVKVPSTDEKATKAFIKWLCNSNKKDIFLVSNPKENIDFYTELKMSFFKNPMLSNTLISEYNNKKGKGFNSRYRPIGAGGSLRVQDAHLQLEFTNTNGSKNIFDIFDFNAPNPGILPREGSTQYIIKIVPNGSEPLSIIPNKAKFIPINSQEGEIDPDNHFTNAPSVYMLTTELEKILNRRMFAIGKYNTPYTGWRRAIATEWMDPAFQKELIQAHQEGGGWPLLEKPLVFAGQLLVADGYAQINAQYTVHVGYNESDTETLDNVYPAKNISANVAWTMTEPAPAPGNNWTVKNITDFTSFKNYPCLFVLDPNPSKKGGRRTHRKHSKTHLKKHKKTRIRRHL